LKVAAVVDVAEDVSVNEVNLRIDFIDKCMRLFFFKELIKRINNLKMINKITVKKAKMENQMQPVMLSVNQVKQQ
jgi:hypothetical protein